MSTKKESNPKQDRTVSRRYEICRDYAIICSGLFLGCSFIRDVFSVKFVTFTFLCLTLGFTLLFMLLMFFFRKRER